MEYNIFLFTLMRHLSSRKSKKNIYELDEQGLSSDFDPIQASSFSYLKFP